MENTLEILVCIDILLTLWKRYEDFKAPKPLSSLEHFLFMYDFRDEFIKMMQDTIIEQEEKIQKAREMQEFYNKMKGKNDK